MNYVQISNVSASAKNWAPGETGTISFTFTNVSGVLIPQLILDVGLRRSDFGGTSADITLARLAGKINSVAGETVNLANGWSKNYTAVFTITDEIAQYFLDYPAVRSVPIYVDYTAQNTTLGNFGEYEALPGDLRVLNCRFNPRISVFALERATGATSNDEGENVLTDLRLAISAVDHDYSGFLSAKIYYAQGRDATTADSSINITGQIGTLLSGVENSTTLITGTYSNGSNWDFLLVFGDEFETAQVHAPLFRAFANVHLSGASTGGASFGGFGTSTEGNPKLESYYPAHFYAGIEGVSNYASGEVKTGGKWIDGKPIYRSVIETGAKTANVQNIDVSALGIETITSMRGMLYAAANYGDGLIFPVPTVATSTSYLVQLSATNRSTITITSTSFVFGSGFLVIEYTKVND